MFPLLVRYYENRRVEICTYKQALASLMLILQSAL